MGGRRKRSSSPTREPSVEKKLKTSSVAHKSPSITGRLVIDLTSFKGKKEAAGSELVKPVTLRVARIIADRIA